MNPSVVISTAFIVVLVILVVAVAQRKNKRRWQTQVVGLSWLQSLRVLLSHVQQHRGLTTAYLNGRREILSDIEQVQRLISRDIKDISQVNGWIDQQESWSGITQHWARLAGGFKNNPVDNNITQHNALIHNILYFIDDMAQAHDLLLLKVGDGKAFHLAWRELLWAGEHIGQARAVGMGICALGFCDSIARIRLNFLCEKVRDNTSQVWLQIQPGQAQREAVEALLSFINEHLLHEKVGVEPAVYFNVASTAIDSLHDQYDRLVEEQRWLLKG